jgi:hypothetical protein
LFSSLFLILTLSVGWFVLIAGFSLMFSFFSLVFLQGGVRVGVLTFCFGLLFRFLVFWCFLVFRFNLGVQPL